VFGQDNLLLGALNGSCELMVVSLLEFLPSLVHVSTHPADGTDALTMLLSCASATKLCASARTSSCSSWTILVLWGSLYFSLAISSDTCAWVSMDSDNARETWYLRFVVATWLHGALRIADLLQYTPILL
jgi:hypothetical protein